MRLQRKSKILLHSDNEAYGGADIVFLSLLKFLVKMGHHPVVATTDRCRELISKVKVLNVPLLIIPSLKQTSRFANVVCRMLGIDLLYYMHQFFMRRDLVKGCSLALLSNGGMPGAVSVYSALLFFKIFCRVNTLLWLHGHSKKMSCVYPLYNSYLFQKYLFQRMITSCVFVSNAVKQSYMYSLSPCENPGEVLYNIVEPKDVKSFLDEQEFFVFAYCGYFVKYKGVFKLINDFSRLTKLRHDKKIQLHLFGDGPDRVALAQIIERENMHEYIFLHEWVSELDYRHFDCVVLPSISTEGLPTVLIESLSAGVPIVASRVGGIPEIVSEDVGLLYDNSDEEGLLQAMIIMLDKNIDTRKQMSNDCRKRYFKHFSVQAVQDAWRERLSRFM